ncbi:class I SAM-dependent methyltransferase [Streptosporangium roseum]|uniref:Methyltransferase domain-containing protein n=1 Tax=Streptosporangium roseum (strain ATCC 12428 / DSM 43021 / JCM 3005 / KCTC 9067 / NCIMB 10171 / NRRL 2505 / NI 9100) TaxID=479432 RepID=D2AZV5_STRRD|nr:class I SAM-dependent methyltransferase [Streptosporangium roseum]ACZ87189.1 hypothetical protein Sros_4300 [Streptosporangium roseum DSM 43021]
MASYWQRTLEDFEKFLSDRPGSGYIDWQPTKWQSLLNVRDILLENCWPAGTTERSALELGCGSATLLSQLASCGVESVGVDRDPAALRLAEAAVKSMGMDAPTLILGDFNDPVTVGNLQADLVLHVGVIEHFDRAGQLSFLDLSRSLARSHVLVAVPNESSPVFRSFITAMERADRVYEDDHEEISVPDLAAELGLEITISDGAHVFLGKREYYNRGDADLDRFYEEVGERLRDLDPDRYAAFPDLDFSGIHVEDLRRIERELDREQRLRFGFLTYYLLRVPR